MQHLDSLVVRLLWAAVYTTTQARYGSVNAEMAADAADVAVAAYRSRFFRETR